MNSIADL